MSVSSVAIETTRTPTRIRRIPRWVHWMFVIFVATCILVAVAAAIFWFWQHQQHTAAAAEIEAEIARLHCAGEPLTPEEMQAFHRVPAGVPDTTELWLKPIRLLAKSRQADRAILSDQGAYELSKLSAPGESNWVGMAEDLLESRQDAIDAALKAANADGQARFPIDFAQGFEAELKHIQPGRHLMQLLRLRHRVSLVKGDQNAAIQSLDAMFALQDAMGQEPHVLGQIMRVAFFREAHQELQELLAHADLSEPDLATIQRHVAQMDFAAGARIGLLGERVMGYHVFLHDVDMATEDPSLPPKLGRKRDFPQRTVDCNFYLTQMREQIDSTSRSLSKGWLCDMRVHNRLAEFKERAYKWQQDDLALSDRLLGNMVHQWLVAAEARRDSAVAAIAARRYQVRHGKLPDRLSELVPEYLDKIPADPFLDGGQTLQLVRQGGRVAVFSVGDDQEADLSLFEGDDSDRDVGFVLAVKPGACNSTQE